MIRPFDESQRPTHILEFLEILSEITDETLEVFRSANQDLGMPENLLQTMCVLSYVAEQRNATSVRFIKKAKLIYGLGSEGVVYGFEYDGWYIDPTHIFEMRNDHLLACPKDALDYLQVFVKDPITYIMLKNYGVDAYEFIGLDFTDKRWIRRFLRKATTDELAIEFLMAYISPEDYEDFAINMMAVRNDRNATHSDYFYGAHYIVYGLMCSSFWHDKLDGIMPLEKRVRVASCRQPYGQKTYWVEFGDHYIIRDIMASNGFRVGKLHELPLRKEQCCTMREFALNALVNRAHH